MGRPLKGVALVSSLQYARETHGEDGLRRALDALAEGDRQTISTALASSWYPLDAYVSWLAVERRVLCGGDAGALAKRIHVGVEQQLTGLYRAFVRQGSPETLFERLNRISGQYLQGIDAEVGPVTDGKTTLTYRGFEARHQPYEDVMVIWWKEALGLSGARDVVARILTSIGEGKGYGVLELNWSR